MTVRILADDLTGALDTAAQFTRQGGPVPVFLDAPATLTRSAALDVQSRELPLADAVARAAHAAGFLSGGDIQFRKIDSQMRGHWAAELKATLDAAYASCVLAPAYPAQGRVTMRGQQWLRSPNGSFRPLGGGILGALAEIGLGPFALPSRKAPSGADLRVYDAQSDEDLRRIVADAQVLPKPILWCGSAGLAGALGGGAQKIDMPDLPFVAIVGSNHPASLAQLDQARGLPPGAHVSVRADSGGAGATIEASLATRPAVLVTFPFPPGEEPAAASAEIRRRLARIIAGMKPPPLLFVTGGETLRGICDITGTTSLAVEGEIEPGVPISTLYGGSWSTVRVISKSGGFGDEGFLARLLRAPPPPPSPPPRTVP